MHMLFTSSSTVSTLTSVREGAKANFAPIFFMKVKMQLYILLFLRGRHAESPLSYKYIFIFIQIVHDFTCHNDMIHDMS